ncbi:SLBB domain-containing protein [Caldithrix abyssi]
MRQVIFFILISFWVSFLSAQSLEDLKKIEELKKQLENAGAALEKAPEKEIPEIKSLETFKDQETPPPPAPEEAKNEEEAPTKAVEEAPAPPTIFGFNVFEKARIDFSPEVYGPVDEDYPIGPGDEVIITLWGEVELRHDLTVDREGQIFIDNVGVVKLAGLTLKQARKKLFNLMGRSYSSLLNKKAFLDVSLGKLRSIRVYVIGDVKAPGVFTVPALSTPLHLLFYAGGVEETASLRNIQVIRNDRKIADIDFYEFLKKGTEFSNIRLQTHDVILVPTAQKRVHLNGAVKKPAIFELKKNEGLKELIELAGGFVENAYLANIQIQRFVDHQDLKLISVDYRKLLENNENFELKNGDRVSVPYLDRELLNYVTISGPIYGPDRFEFRAGMTIKDLMKQIDSIRGDAYLERVHVTRTLPDRRQQILVINLKEILESPQADFPLAPQDHIAIASSLSLFPPDSVAIYGAVNKPGKYLLKKDMSLKDLIFAAGGFKKNALITEAEISRIYPFKPERRKELAKLIYVPIDSNYTKALLSSPDEQFFLKPFDNVFIRFNSDWELQRNVTVQGEVFKPGAYTLQSKTERITDLIKRAGGLKPTAYLEGARFYRIRDGVGQIGIDFKKIFKNPNDAQNIYLQAGDRIVIPEKMFTVRVVGGVHFPVSVLYEKGKGIDHYIKAAGGFTDLADKDNVTIRLANGKQIQPKRFLFWKYLPEKITAGSTIYVPVLAEKREIDWSGAVRDAAAILSSVATTLLIYDRLVK